MRVAVGNTIIVPPPLLVAEAINDWRYTADNMLRLTGHPDDTLRQMAPAFGPLLSVVGYRIDYDAFMCRLEGLSSSTATAAQAARRQAYDDGLFGAFRPIASQGEAK